MKVGINATCLNARPSGARQRFVGIYRELVKRLPEAEFLVYEPADCRVASWFDGAANVTARPTPLPSEGRAGRLLGGLRYWGPALARDRFDLFECLNLPVVKSPSGRILTTIHDIRGLRPGASAWERTLFKSVLSRSLKTVDRVITVSEAMKREILAFHPGVPVSVVYNGLDAGEYDRVSAEDLREFSREFPLPADFALAVGHFEARKNYLRLIDAMALLRDRGRPSPLVIIGNDSGGRAAVETRIAATGLGGSVRILSGLSDLEVRCAYKLCGLFVFPSTYEGFGIPILEAMAARRPMVLSDIPVFREITQDRGVYFPPDDAERMASAIEKTLASTEDRSRLVDYGSERIKAFDFPSLGARLADAYRAAL